MRTSASMPRQVIYRNGKLIKTFAQSDVSSQSGLMKVRHRQSTIASMANQRAR